MAKIQVLMAILLTVFLLSTAQTNAARTHVNGPTPLYYCLEECAKIEHCSIYCFQNGYPKGGFCGTGNPPRCCCIPE
ncbi:hypothetical protein AMTRI_Chr07g75690 [Amborella trichopoda]